MKYYRVSSQSLNGIPRSLKNRAYLKFIRGLFCIVCGQNWSIDAAHTGARGVGQRATDLETLPLCRKCHDEYHRIGRMQFCILHSLDIPKIIATLQARAVACGVDLSVDDRPKRCPGRAVGFKRSAAR